MNDVEEDSPCPKGCGGKMIYKDVEDCYCHISPPCGNCVNNPLVCDWCSFTIERED